MVPLLRECFTSIWVALLQALSRSWTRSGWRMADMTVIKAWKAYKGKETSRTWDTLDNFSNCRQDSRCLHHRHRSNYEKTSQTSRILEHLITLESEMGSGSIPLLPNNHSHPFWNPDNGDPDFVGFDYWLQLSICSGCIKTSAMYCGHVERKIWVINCCPASHLDLIFVGFFLHKTPIFAFLWF